jgi:RHS repeat-associated protein
MTYNYSATQNNGRISSSVDGITGESTSYTYDALNRLMAASNSLWSQSYTYDGFGNLLTKSLANGSPDPSPSLNLTYNANNQQNGLSYDANGNQLSLPSCGAECGNTYSAENRMVEQNLGYYSTSPVNIYTYDPWGKRVMSGTDSFGGPNGAPTPNYTYTFYGITGQPLATLNCNGSNYPAYPVCAITGQNVYYGKKRIVAGGVPVVTDRLGTVRSDTQGDSYAYYPYGEERTSTVNGLYKFATYFRDTIGQDYADQRFYNAGTGRFWNVDPGGMATANGSNPTSWNRYAYVNGDPVNFGDPAGLDSTCGPFATFDGEGCINTGGSAPSGPAYGCNDDWATFGEGCSMGDDAGVGGCYGDGSGFLGMPDPGCQTGGGSSGPASTPPPSVSLRETSACTEAHGSQTGNFTLDITYQVMVNGAAVTSNLQLYNLGIYLISEQLTNPTGTMGTSGANWCLGMASASCPSQGQVGLLNDGTFVDELSGQGTLTQSFYLNGTGAPLQVAFGALSFVGPLQSYTALNNTYNSRVNPPSVTVAGGAFSSVGAPPCNK